ncbi:MAG: TerC family protein [Bryobacterales bacterium]|nr:TerC family protein [Bryobacterales bacterium]
MTELFPFASYWWFYAGFTALVLVLLALDLGVFHRDDHVVSLREATIWTAIWVTGALLFNAGLYYYATDKFGEEVGRRVGLEFLAGYLVEESLSVDNIFVFIMLFRYFAIPPIYQHRILFFGILGAIFFRAIFIALGAVLMQYHWVVILFGVFLIFTGAKMLFSKDESVHPSENPLLKLMRRFLPVTNHFHGHDFFARVNGVLAATPLLVTLLVVETTDIVFALDSVPAVYGLTKEPLIVFTSNIFAILGLRSMYFVLADAIDRFHLLKHGVALVLVFVGLKMSLFAGLPIVVSLAVICVVLAGSIVLSFMVAKKPVVAAEMEPDPNN